MFRLPAADPFVSPDAGTLSGPVAGAVVGGNCSGGGVGTVIVPMPSGAVDAPLGRLVERGAGGVGWGFGAVDVARGSCGQIGSSGGPAGTGAAVGKSACAAVDPCHALIIPSINFRAIYRVYRLICTLSNGAGTSTTARASDRPSCFKSIASATMRKCGPPSDCWVGWA